MTAPLALLKQRDLTAMALRINRQDIDELVRNCRWVVKYRKDRPDVFAEYLRVLRSFTEAQERAVEFGMGDGPLAQPIEPLPIWRGDYRWSDMLPAPVKPSKRIHRQDGAEHQERTAA